MNGFESKSPVLPFIEDKFIDVNDLWRSSKNPVNEIGVYRIECRVITFLKTNSGHTYTLLGIVKWLGQINRIDCAGIELDDPYKYGNSGKLDNRNKFQAKSKHGVYTPITNMKLVVNYTSATIPNHLKTSKDIDVQSRVKVYRVSSNNLIEKYYGTVLWTGHNDCKDYFYGVKLDSPITEGTDGIFSCQRLFLCKNNLGMLAPVGTVKKCNNKIVSELRNIKSLWSDKEKYQAIIMMLLKYQGDVNHQNEDNETIFDIASTVGDDSVLHSMFDACLQSVNLSLTQSMKVILTKLVELEKWNCLFQILQGAIIDENSNKYLLLLGISVLNKTNRIEFFDRIIQICKDKNTILHNGETFLTTLLKSNIPVLIIANIIQKNIFDVNKPNLKKETPLILACEFLMTDIVKLLIKLNCDIKFNNRRAIEVAVLAKNKAASENDKSKMEDGSKIIDLLSEANDTKESLLCQICMDKNKNIALNCGHLICSTCESKLSSCPFCNLAIRKSLKIYL